MLPPIDNPAVTSTLTIGHVLFMDIVAYSRLPMDEQRKLVATLQESVRQTATFTHAQHKQRLISIPTGDGMALVFFEDPEYPVRCAMELSQKLRGHPEIKLRMGIHTGPVYRLADINANQNVSGGGINVAQRVMECGDEAHILVSKAVADTLLQLGTWDKCLYDLGETEVKHGFRVHLYNLHTSECGNAELPQRMKSVPWGSPGSHKLSPRELAPTMLEIPLSENAPQRIGDYEIIRELGHGGMGKVYQVRNVLSDRVEAMKVVLPDLAARSEFAGRFMREIKVLASLDHPNIAALRTAFTADEQLVMIMEYVDGITLADRLEQGPFSTAEALSYVDQVLAALSYAHGKHVIHRDIKPGNMMRTPQGVVKLMDFGLARSGSEMGLTMAGTAVGSVDFMSPEQVQSLPADERSDLYSVGVSFYQMVTGQRMFRATSGYSIMEAHVKETPRPPIEIQPTLPKAVSDLIMMSVAKNPAERFQTADAFRNALAQARAPLSQPAAQATTTTMVGLPLPASTAAPSSRPATPPLAESVRATPSPGVAQPAPAIAGRGLLLAVAAVLLFVVLAGAWIYKSRQQPGMGSSPAGTSAQSSSTSSASPPQASAPVPQQPPPGSVPPNAISSPATPAQETAPRNSANKRSTANASPKLTPGGAAPDSQAQDQAAAALAQKKLLDELEKESDQLDSRAAAAESSLATLEQQMHASGYGLRGDIVAARANMRNDLAKAKQAMDSTDTDRARHFLDMAHREVEKLEDFLGRR